MKKLIITEEERSRILEMHQNATARQYLTEEFSGPKINDGNAALKYFSSLYAKNKSIKKGDFYLGKNTYWIATSDWVPQGVGMPGTSADNCDILMRGVVIRNGLYFDISGQQDIESIVFQFGYDAGTKLYALSTQDGDAASRWNAGLQMITAKSSGVPGGNAGLVGGLQNFKSMVNGLPNKQAALQNYLEAKQNPKFKDQTIPQDQRDLYGSTPTKQPTQPK